jgi:very-short-patch-repair endonuclease
MKIAQLAAPQQGHVTRAQLLALGVPAARIGGWIAAGRLVRVHQGVYAVGYRRLDAPAAAMAAVLACGPGALLSHESAAALWGWRRWPSTPEVTVARDRRPSGVRTHRTTTLRPADRDRQLGIPVTAPERTIRDLGPRLTPAQLRRIVSEARFERRLDDDAVARLLGYGPAPTRSEMQDRFQIAVIDAERLPQPLTDTTVEGFEVDAVWPDHRFVVELDGWDAHRGREAFVTDRERDAVLAERGWLVVRITSDRLYGDPRREGERLRRILAARAPRKPAESPRAARAPQEPAAHPEAPSVPRNSVALPEAPSVPRNPAMPPDAPKAQP